MKQIRSGLALVAVLMLVATACGKSGGSTTGPTIYSTIGATEGSLNLIAWNGYVENGQADPKFDWVTPFQDQTRAAR